LRCSALQVGKSKRHRYSEPTAAGNSTAASLFRFRFRIALLLKVLESSHDKWYFTCKLLPDINSNSAYSLQFKFKSHFSSSEEFQFNF